MPQSTNQSKKFRWVTPVIAMLILSAVFVVYFVQTGTGLVANEVIDNTPPPPAVGVITIRQQSVRAWTGFSGRLTPVQWAEIKPLVSGELQQVLFEDGQVVSKDALLFVIDPRPFKAAVQRAEAQLGSAQSRRKLAKDELQRVSALLERKLISQSMYDSAHNAVKVAEAEAAEMKTVLDQAQLDLAYCYIRAPFSGRVSRAEITVGNIVETTPNAPVLTTIVATDQLYAEFNVDEQTYIKSVRGGSGRNQAMPVEMSLTAEPSLVYQGRIDSFDNQLDTSSGTIRARAIFNNTDGALTSGMFVNVRLGAAVLTEALLVPNKAIGTNQDKKFVYLIGADNRAVYREIKLGDQFGSQRSVLNGLATGDRVVVNGLSHVRPNVQVMATEIDQSLPIANAAVD